MGGGPFWLVAHLWAQHRGHACDRHDSAECGWFAGDGGSGTAPEPVWRVLVEYANGDDFTAPRQWSHVEVAAADEREARLVGAQLALTPRREKPAHIQTTSICAVPA